MADLLDSKRSQIVGARMADARVTKTAELFWCSMEYSLESNDSIWERMKNLLTETKVCKKVKTVL